MLIWIIIFHLCNILIDVLIVLFLLFLVGCQVLLRPTPVSCLIGLHWGWVLGILWVFDLRYLFFILYSWVFEFVLTFLYVALWSLLFNLILLGFWYVCHYALTALLFLDWIWLYTRLLLHHLLWQLSLHNLLLLAVILLLWFIIALTLLLHHLEVRLFIFVFLLCIWTWGNIFCFLVGLISHFCSCFCVPIINVSLVPYFLKSIVWGAVLLTLLLFVRGWHLFIGIFKYLFAIYLRFGLANLECLFCLF